MGGQTVLKAGSAALVHFATGGRSLVLDRRAREREFLGVGGRFRSPVTGGVSVSAAQGSPSIGRTPEFALLAIEFAAI